MRAINFLALTLVIIGALNWLLVGLFSFNLVDTIFGIGTFLTKLVYILVGISGIWAILFYSKVQED